MRAVVREKKKRVTTGPRRRRLDISDDSCVNTPLKEEDEEEEEEEEANHLISCPCPWCYRTGAEYCGSGYPCSWLMMTGSMPRNDRLALIQLLRHAIPPPPPPNINNKVCRYY